MVHVRANPRIRTRMMTLSGMLLVMIGLGASTSLSISGGAMDWYLSNARHSMSADERSNLDRWALLRAICPESARIIATHEQQLSGRLMLVIDLNPGRDTHCSPGWQDVVLVVSRESMSGCLLARAVEPIPIPSNLDDANVWDHWMHDSRVRMSWMAGSKPDGTCGLPRSIGRTDFSDHEFSWSTGDPTPVDPCNGR